MRRSGVTIRVSREHAEMLQQLKEKFCYPSFTSASAWLTKKVKESGIMEEEKKEEVERKPKKFDIRITK